ncbi:MAG: hypothetical protein ACRDNS_25725 [Trebonia sp.]
MAPTAGTRSRSHPAAGTAQTGRWILEVHLVDPTRRFGGFYEELLDLP